jgi:hypothetical protein
MFHFILLSNLNRILKVTVFTALSFFVEHSFYDCCCYFLSLFIMILIVKVSVNFINNAKYVEIELTKLYFLFVRSINMTLLRKINIYKIKVNIKVITIIR